MTFATGDRVRVDLTATREQWNKGAADVLHGAVGTVERVVDDHGIAPPRPAALVAFDPPLPKTWSNGSPVKSHWFDLPELRAAGEPQIEHAPESP